MPAPVKRAAVDSFWTDEAEPIAIVKVRSSGRVGDREDGTGNGRKKRKQKATQREEAERLRARDLREQRV